MTRRISRRTFLKSGAMAGAALALGRFSGNASWAQSKGRVVILGFDGVEPSVLEPMVVSGRTPNLAKLQSAGAYARLGTTIPPQSPVAWNTFASCTNPGGHGIYDFIRRDPKNYIPSVGTGTVKQPVLDAQGALTRPPEAVNYSKGRTFWSVADEQGARCKIINVPFVFPADNLKNGIMLCGLGVPDVRGTTSMFYSFSEAYVAKEQVAGGFKIPLQFTDNTAVAEIETVRDPRSKKYLTTPMAFTVDRVAGTLTVTAAEKTLTLKPGVWSEWVEWSFPITPSYTVRALSRFYLLDAGQSVRVYMTCLQYHPRDPFVPITMPISYSSELADRYGLFKTIGWAYDTHALRQDALNEPGFIEDVRQTMSFHESLVLDEFDRGGFELFVAAWQGTDRVGHMFWHHRDPKHPLYDPALAAQYKETLEESYVKMDEITGKVMAKLNDTDLLFVLSDHGFGTFRTGLNVNTWLVRNGYAALKGQTDPATAASDEPWLQSFDWSNTRAYCIGLSSMYLNLKGREGQGIVDPAEADALIAEIKERLLQLTDPNTGEKVLSNVYTRDVYSGPVKSEAPDFVFGFAPAYQCAKSCAKGSVPNELFESNKDKWSGEHAASDCANSPGVLFANRVLTAQDPNIMDIGVTSLKSLGLPVPPDYEGKSIV